jgi:hypothetical protein
MEPWYRVATPRKEVREGRSFNPDEFAIHLEQVIGGTAPEDYKSPSQFFSRTCFTRALRDHAGMVLRRLSGETSNTAPVMTLITQFGGGKTHTLTALYHLAHSGAKASEYDGVSALLSEAGLGVVPSAKEFSKAVRLAKFDRTDRKFVATALAHGANPRILVAVDSDWWLAKEALAEAGVRVEFLCAADLEDTVRRKKSGGRIVR